MRQNEISVSEAAEKIGVSRSTVIRLIDDDEFDARRKTRSGPWFLTEASVDEYIDEEDLDTGDDPDEDDDRDEDDEDDSDDRDDDEYQRGHSDGFKEAKAECDVENGDHTDDEDDRD